jgi:hypothetical protein
MFKTLNITADIPGSREVKIVLPPDVPVGPAELVVTINSKGDSVAHTLGELAESEFIGMWRDRGDITNSEEFARKLREDAWRRSA